MSFKLVDTGWDQVLHKAVGLKCDSLKVICPFIKVRTAKRLLAAGCPKSIQIITRFHLGEMCLGVSDMEALRLLLENDSQIRGVSNLHAKLYIFGCKKVIVTSANLTESALLRNHEFGFVSSKPDIIDRCHEYFGSLWKRAGADLNAARLTDWEERIEGVRVRGTPPARVANLPDEGTNAGALSWGDTSGEILTPSPNESPQSFVKFFGEAKPESRANRNKLVLHEVRETGCHWACAYPRDRRPRQVCDGALIFMGRLVQNKDILIFGRAVGMAHVEGRDEATAAEIKRRPWKKVWPNYIRVHSAEFLAGTLNGGVSLNELMEKLGPDSFVTTQLNAKKGKGNVNPRAAYKQQPGVQLTRRALAWLNAKLELAFVRNGKLAKSELQRLDWPDVPYTARGTVAHVENYKSWLRQTRRKANTANEYAYFLLRCAKHYGETIDEKSVSTRADAMAAIRRVKAIVEKIGRTGPGTFNRRDITQNLSPALSAYADFISAKFAR
jgi:hypothetical protein